MLKKVLRVVMLMILLLMSLIQNSFATSTSELNSISAMVGSVVPVVVIIWVMIGYFIVTKIKNNKALKKVMQEEKNEYYEKIKKMTREEQFKELSNVVGNILREGYQRNQGNLSKRVASILQIKTCPIKYKTLSAFKKEDYQDVLKTSNPFELIGFSKFYIDGRVECIVTPNVSRMSIENKNRLNRINTGDDNTPLYPITHSELIKNNPNIDVIELIKTLESRC